MANRVKIPSVSADNADWGLDSHGQASPPDGNDFVAIAAGWYHSLAIAEPCQYALVGDMNDDCKVDFRDYAIFALRWLDTGCVDPTWCGKTDLDKSGDVNLPDLKIFAGHWLE